MEGLGTRAINLAFTALGLLIIGYSLYLLQKIGKKTLVVSVLLSSVLLLGTLSATAIFLFIIFTAYTLFVNVRFRASLIGCLLVFSLLWGMHELLIEFRPYSLFIKTLSDPMYVIGNSSLFYRVFHNMVAILYFIDMPTLTGLGAGAFDQAASYVVDVYNFKDSFPARDKFIEDGLKYGFGIESKNIISLLIIEHGMIGILFYVFVLRHIFKHYVKGLTGYVAIYFIIASIQSTPLVFPMLWMLVSINFYVYKKTRC